MLGGVISRTACRLAGLVLVLAGMYISAAAETGSSPVICDRHVRTDVLMLSRMELSQEHPQRPLRLNDLNQENIPGLKSPSKALALSLLLPGVGHLYAGANARHRIYFSTEAACWLAFGAFTVWGNQKENEFKGWAATHAGVDPRGKPDDFWRMMTYYDSRNEYEIYGRADDPQRPGYANVAGWDWQWDSDSSRSHYRQVRNSAKEADRRATFSIGAMVVNRIVAAIDAFRSAKAYNRQKGMQLTLTRLRLNGNPFGTNQNFMLVFERVF